MTGRNTHSVGTDRLLSGFKMKKDLYAVLVATAMLVLIGTESGWAKVRRIIDEDDVTAFTGQSTAVPNGLTKTSDGSYIFFETTDDAILRYNPDSGKLTSIAAESALASAATGSDSANITGCDLEVDSSDNVYAMVGALGKYYVLRVPHSKRGFQKPEKILELPKGKLYAYELEIDQANSKLVMLMDTYDDKDDATRNGIYTFDLTGNIPGNANDLVKLATFRKIAAEVTPPLIPGKDQIGGTGLAIEAGYAYWHLTVGPPHGHGADGDLVRINMATGNVSVFLERNKIVKDIAPDGVGADGNFYFTTFAVDGKNLFMLVNVGVCDRMQNVYHYEITDDMPIFKGMTASVEELLVVGDSLGTPIIVYSPECEARDGKFYIFTASNMKENLLEIIPDDGEPSPIRVAIYKGPAGSGGKVPDALEGYSDIMVQRVSPEDIQNGILSDFDVLIQPGGSGSKQANALGEKGRKAIQNFVHEGGGYIGVCAGAYLASSGYSWSLHIIDAIVIERAHWARSNSTVKIELTPEGRRILGYTVGPVDVYYAQGPVLAPAGKLDLPDYKTLAFYRTGTSRNGALEGVMCGSPAVIVSEYGKGRVACISPHPEKTPGLEYYIYRAVRWAAGERTGTSPFSKPE